MPGFQIAPRLPAEPPIALYGEDSVSKSQGLHCHRNIRDLSDSGHINLDDKHTNIA